MAVLDHAIWLTGSGGTAESGVSIVSDGANNTTVTGTFTASVWDASQSGYNVSDFGVFGVSAPTTARFEFSEIVENLTFDLQHVNSDASHDDLQTIYAYDENGDLLDSADVIAGLSGLVDELVYVNSDGSVSIEANGGTSNDVTVSLPGFISEISITIDNGPDAPISGGTGISDFSFTVPDATDTDGDGIIDSIDIDDDDDGILDTNEGFSTASPSTITITFDGDEYSSTESSWELRDPNGNLIGSDTSHSTSVEITDIPVAGLGDYTFTIYDSYGDGLVGPADPASYSIAIDGESVFTSAANPNFGTSITKTFTVAEIETTADSDGDGIADHLDLDSDNDGITDNVEAQTTDGYITPSRIDSDGDGLDDAYEPSGLTPVDTDSDGKSDYLDHDSDNDGITDADEAGHGISQATIDASGDTDGDGIKDVVDDVSGRDVNDADIDGIGNFTLADTDNDTAPDGSGATPLTEDLDFRDAVPCFTPGTLIATESGEIPVEKIRVGDMVFTVDNGLQPVRWIGSKSLTQVDLAQHFNLRPIVIRKYAFGNRRKMLVSPQHGLIWKTRTDERLIRAKHAAETFGGKYARVEKRCERVTYVHIMFDQHELIYAEGAMTESFYPGPMALMSLNQCVLSELLLLFPELENVSIRNNTVSKQYGRPARRYLRRKEARSIANQMANKSPPIC